jgi:hypothetical protein
MIDRFAEALRVLRPRALAQTRKHVEDLRGDIAGLRDDVRNLRAALKEAHDEQCAQVAQVERTLAQLDARQQQLRAMSVREIELEGQLPSLDAITSDHGAAPHIRRRVSAAEFSEQPFPHLVVDDLLPRPLYDALVAGLPPVEMFNDNAANRQQLTVPFRLAPTYCRRVWNHMVDVVVPSMLMPALFERFSGVMDRWVREQFPAAGVGIDGLKVVPSDGRILLRTRGYVIPPHRDPKWGFVTCILYLARRGDSPAWGTQLYEVDGDSDARGALPHWIDGRACRQFRDVEFVPNRALVFMNSTGAHGATIPNDAPAGLERYIYQFRLGPNGEGKTRLLNSLSGERRDFWAARAGEY